MKKKTLVVILLALCCAATVGAVTACDGNKEDPNKQFEQTEFTVSFESNGGTAIADQGVLGNGKIADPGAPIKYGYDFVGWYKNEACTEKWNFDTDTVKEDTTLYALWEIKDATADTYFDFTAQEDGTTAISLKTGQNLPADVVLPSVHAEKAVTAIKDGAFEGQAAVKSFLIPDSVKRIGARAFRNCANLEQILGASNVESIGGTAFGGTKYDVELSGGAVYLGKTLYKYAGGMYTDTELEVTAGTLGIAAGAFQDMEKLTKVTLPAGLKNIGNYAFGGATKGTGLTEVVIPDSVESVGDNVFRNSAQLATVTVGKGVKSIGLNAFAGTAITELTYNAADATVADNSFPATKAAATVTVGDDVTAFPAAVVGKFTGATAVTLGAGITDIPDNAFKGFASLAAVTINGTLTSIGASAFEGTAITEYTVNKEVTKIGNNAFKNCASLAKVDYNAPNATAPASAAAAFGGCAALKTVVVGGEVTNIPDYLFKDCSALATLTLGANVTSIGQQAFYGTALKSVTIPAKVTELGADAFGNCSALASVEYNATNAAYSGTTALFVSASAITVGDGVTNIPSYFAQGNAVITSITLPSGVHVGDYAFQNCTALATIVGYDTVGSIGAASFEGSKYYEENDADGVQIQGSIITGFRGEMPADYTLEVPAGKTVTSIAAEAFKDQTNLVGVVLPDTLEVIGAGAFWGCTALKGTVDLKNVTWVGDNAFQGAAAIEKVVLGEKLESIGANAFRGLAIATFDDGAAEGVNKLTLPASVTTLGEYAFQGCAAVTAIEVRDGVTTIPQYTFDGCALTAIKLAASVERVGFRWATLSQITEFIAPGLKYLENGSMWKFPIQYDWSGIVEFGENVFQNATGIVEFTVGENCTKLGERLFTLTTGLQKVTINSTKITKIPEKAFFGCEQLTEVIVKSPIVNIGANAFATNAYADQGGKKMVIKEFDFSHVAVIDDKAFLKVLRIDCDVNLPVVTKIGESAFNEVTIPGKVDLGTELESVLDYAFQKSTIGTLVLHENTNVFGKEPFGAIGTVELAEGVTTMYPGKDDKNNPIALFKTVKDGMLIVPSTLKTVPVGYAAMFKVVKLNAYTALTDFTLGASAKDSSFNPAALFHCASDEVKNQYLADTSVWKEKAGENWDAVWKDRFVSGLVSVGDWFLTPEGALAYYAGSRTNVTIPKELKSFGSVADIVGSQKADLQAVRFSVEEGSTSFKMQNGALLSFDGTTLYFFCGGADVTEVVFETVTTVKEFALAYNQYLTSVELPNVVEIGNEAIRDYLKLTTLVIGDKCTKIGDSALFKVGGNVNITIKSTTPPALGTQTLAPIPVMFKGKIYVPAECVDAYKAANGWSTFAAKIEAISAPEPAPANLA